MGIGSEEDSLASWKNLRPKPVKKNFQQFMKNQGRIIRFEARLVNPAPEDEIRRFVIAFYLADDTVSIYEPPIRNSGIWGGSFLKRGKYKNPKTGEYFTANYFDMGVVVELLGRSFTIVSCDKYTAELRGQDK